MIEAANLFHDNNSLNALLLLAVVSGVTLGISTALRFIFKKLQILAARTAGDWDDLILYAFAGTKSWAIFFWLACASLPLLELHESVNRAGRQIAVLVTALQVIIWFLRGIGHWRTNYLETKVATDRSSIAAIGLLGTGLQALVIVVVVLMALSNLGIDVGALVAGLGIGGIAVALAAQNVLGDLLASLSIVLDKPFVVGDFIVVGDKSGTVQNIGIKTTRLRSLQGEELIFSNKALLESQIQNFKRMYERRILIKIGVTYDTPKEKLEQIPGWLKAFVEQDKGLRLDRAHFSGLGASSLDFELVFFVLSGEYNDYMDRQQVLLLAILEKFSEEGIDFAYPSTTMYIQSADKAPLLPGAPAAT